LLISNSVKLDSAVDGFLLIALVTTTEHIADWEGFDLNDIFEFSITLL